MASPYCHIHWLARACWCILVTKIRFIVFSILALLSLRLRHLRIIGSNMASSGTDPLCSEKPKDADLKVARLRCS